MEELVNIIIRELDGILGIMDFAIMRQCFECRINYAYTLQEIHTRIQLLSWLFSCKW